MIRQVIYLKAGNPSVGTGYSFYASAARTAFMMRDSDGPMWASSTGL